MTVVLAHGSFNQAQQALTRARTHGQRSCNRGAVDAGEQRLVLSQPVRRRVCVEPLAAFSQQSDDALAGVPSDLRHLDVGRRVQSMKRTAILACLTLTAAIISCNKPRNPSTRSDYGESIAIAITTLHDLCADPANTGKAGRLLAINVGAEIARSVNCTMSRPRLFIPPMARARPSLPSLVWRPGSAADRCRWSFRNNSP
jgi:hypothetical protein